MVGGDDARFMPSRLTRRRFVQLAAAATTGLVLPIPRVWAADEDDYCTPHASGADPGSLAARSDGRPVRIQAPRDGNWAPYLSWIGAALGTRGDYETSPRKAWVMVHHAGIANSHTNTDPCTSCSDLVGSDQHEYDFCVDAAGDICVPAGSGTPRWKLTGGAHAHGCNCKAVGVMLQGCFGGCASGNASAPTDRQLCSLALLSLELTTKADLNHHRPHRRCSYWNPCGVSSPTATICPGSNLTTSSASDTDKWNATGESLMLKMLDMRACLARGCSCDCRYC